MSEGLAEMERALGYLVQVQEDLRQAEELITRAYAGRAMAQRMVQVSIEKALRSEPRRGGSVATRARKFDDPGALGAA